MASSKDKVHSGPRGLSKDHIVLTAVHLMEAVGEQGFSLRKLGDQVGCDPMAVLYHFKSKEGLHRAMADWLTGQLRAVDAAQPWQQRLHDLAGQYRALALRCPHTFGLMQRFLNTGIADFHHIETVHRALCDAGVRESDIPAVCLGWYATVYGLAMAEVGGLVRRATPEELAEVAALPADAYPLTRRFMPLFLELDPGNVYHQTLDLLHAGIGRKQ